MININAYLPNYFSILNKELLPEYIQAKHIPVSYKSSDSTKELWKKHNNAIKKNKINDILPDKSLLDIKIDIATRIFKNCHFCERRCNIDRTKLYGNCGVKESYITSEFLHLGEESVLVPSHTIFFSGCTFHCVFCQNWDISQNNIGLYIKPGDLAKIIEKRKIQGSKNINWVGGDPTPNILFILKTLKECDLNIPQIWNSNMYCSSETMNILTKVIDLYLTDFKFGNDKCANRLSKVNDYLRIIKSNHKIAYENGEVIIRHLVMPNHIECCSKPLIKWISENTPNAIVNIMAQYRPQYHAYNHIDISRNITSEEFTTIKKYATEYGINEI